MSGTTPKKLLLHVCCAPCSVAIVEELKKSGHDLTVFFYNPNIFPEEEYLKRKNEVIKVCKKWDIQIVDWDYDHEQWESEIGKIPQKGENGPRCSACIRKRLMQAAEYAKEHGFDHFASSLTSGRKKDSKVINAIGHVVAKLAGIDFLDEDWKKKGRWERGLKLAEEMEIYRQKYCGCRHSKPSE